VNTSTPLASIARIERLFAEWRDLGSHRLPSGTELIAPLPTDESGQWLHVIQQGLSVSELTDLQRQRQFELPREMRAFYRRIAAMTLWNGAFAVYGYRPLESMMTDDSDRPKDVLQLNRELESLGWKPKDAFAFAVNGSDMSVHVIGLTDDPNLVHRCERSTGEIIDTHASVWVCISARLYSLNQSMLQ